MRKLLIVALASITVGCANVPKVGELGEGISATGTLFRGAINANRTIALRIGEENQAAALLQGRAFTLGDRPTAMLDKVRTNVRLEAIRALEEYGEALAKAADQGVIDRLEQASMKLGDAAGNLAIAASPMASPLVGPGIKLISRGVGFLLGNMYAAEIHAIVVARNDDIKALAALLKQDMEPISALLAAQAKDFEKARKVNLLLARDDTRVDRLRLYYEFRTARQDANTVKALIAVAAKYRDVLDNLVAAHDAIATGQPDAELALRRFIVLADDLVVLVKAANANREKSG